MEQAAESGADRAEESKWLRRYFTGPQRPAKIADVFLASDKAVASSWMSVVGFLIAAGILGYAALNSDAAMTRWLNVGFCVACLVIAGFGYRAIRGKAARRRHMIVVLAIDMNGVWWSDRRAVGRVTWTRIVGLGIGQVHDSVGGVRSSAPIMATLELFLAEGAHAGGDLGDAVLADKPAPPPGMPAQRLRLPFPERDVDAVRASVGRWAGQAAPPFVGTYSVGVMNTLTGRIG